MQRFPACLLDLLACLLVISSDESIKGFVQTLKVRWCLLKWILAYFITSLTVHFRHSASHGWSFAVFIQGFLVFCVATLCLYLSLLLWFYARLTSSVIFSGFFCCIFVSRIKSYIILLWKCEHFKVWLCNIKSIVPLCVNGYCPYFSWRFSLKWCLIAGWCPCWYSWQEQYWSGIKQLNWMSCSKRWNKKLPMTRPQRMFSAIFDTIHYNRQCK